MPTVEFNFRELNALMGGEFKPMDLRDMISMLGVDLESIDSERVVMEVFPNRPDLLSVEGFSRALKGTLGVETGFMESDVAGSNVKLFIDPSVYEVRPHIAVAVVRGISLDDGKLRSLMDLQEKLHVTHGRNRKKVAIGVHDMENVKPPFTYKAVKPEEVSFTPLDMGDRMNLRQILRRHPKGIAYGWILEGFDRYPVILDVDENVLSFPPIINGELTRLTEDTEEIFIDVTGLDGKAVNQALNILVTSLGDRGGRIYSVDINTFSTSGAYL
jgi:phenylalanyl-tRNA synthetase beta chain